MVSSHQSHEKSPWCCIDRYGGPCSHVYDWWEETMVLYRHIEWSLFSWMWLVRRDHGWDQGPLYLSIQHHGLFSPIPFMRTETTLSVYTIPWSLLTNTIHETSDHSICLYNIVIGEKRPWCCIDRVVPGLMNGIGEKRPWCCIDR
jgi:hypothetical protein